MRYASLALLRDMLRVGCNSSGISSMHVCDRVTRLIKWEGTAVVAFAWSGLFVARLCSLKRSRSVRLVSPIIVFYIFYSGSHYGFKIDDLLNKSDKKG